MKQPGNAANPRSRLSSILTTTNTLHVPSGVAESEEGADPFLVNTLEEVPEYVLEYAPLVHLNTNEPFWPASIEEHLRHTVLKVPEGGASRPEEDDPCALLALPEYNHERCFLTAAQDVRPDPLLHPWLVSSDGKPGPDGKSAVSPVILILVDKSAITGVPGTLDAFWFFFYSFNLGPTVANIHFGNHIADWEHCMMRFENGQPKAAHLSAHADGASYVYECLEKIGKRPVIFSALGSHALYPKPGVHDYSPVKIVGPRDQTDRGPLWDPVLNYAAFQHYPSPARDKFRAIEHDKHHKLVPCLKFCGQWGDEFSSLPIHTTEGGGGSWIAKINMIQPMKRKMSLHNLRWGDGVTGPRDKDLDRPGMNRYSHRIHTSY
ncbi:hypothetical protein PCASD_06129 [Puccinia coronata f. sp. avenae]|uniref:Vacuolar protein sorting-associated protein 62 n=1 Tax=Puccinia coronata f. sp. avenae TaxID=200324 RepID=A0A2N5UZZ5_9BASI|nr:hypothetical protein PCASD_06129 [Puccinia coronata f. sp. avenae]